MKMKQKVALTQERIRIFTQVEFVTLQEFMKLEFAGPNLTDIYKFLVNGLFINYVTKFMGGGCPLHNARAKGLGYRGIIPNTVFHLKIIPYN